MKKLIKSFCPPIVFDGLKKLKRSSERSIKSGGTDGSIQDLDIYWTSDMANQLENWGKDHTWNEIECFLVNCKGKVCDIACGTGVNIKSLSRFPFLEVYGYDISDLLLEKAKQKGIDPKYLKIYDATKTGYQNGEFDFSYSIGSLEHFTEVGISLFLKECNRYTTMRSFHMVPVSENNLNNGWIKRGQSYFNNSVEWWLSRFQEHFSKIYIINSGWKDQGVSVGKWFVCIK